MVQVQWDHDAEMVHHAIIAWSYR